jgi:short subunit fatty acids transporter
MAVTTTIAAVPSARPVRSVAAVLAGFLAVAVLSLVTDQILHVLQVYPPWGEPMWDPKLNLLAFTYRTVYSIVGGYLAASLAPHRRMRHVVALGILGTIAGTAGVIATWNLGFGPRWYPIALALTGLPCVWLGGAIFTRRPAHPM